MVNGEAMSILILIEIFLEHFVFEFIKHLRTDIRQSSDLVTVDGGRVWKNSGHQKVSHVLFRLDRQQGTVKTMPWQKCSPACPGRATLKKSSWFTLQRDEQNSENWRRGRMT